MDKILDADIKCPLIKIPEFEPCDVKELDQLVEYLKTGEKVDSKKKFQRGTLIADGRLDLCKQKIGPGGVAEVTSALKSYSHVSHLLLGLNAMGDEGAGYVADLVSASDSLETVYLGCNKITEQGVQRLADEIAKKPNVKHLWLKRNPIRDASIPHITRMIRSNLNMTTLDLVNTGLTPRGLEMLAEALINHKTGLKYLFLGGNGIGTVGAKILRSIVAADTSLEGLFMNVNRLEDEGITILSEGIKQNDGTLKQLGIGSNGITYEGFKNLAEVLFTYPLCSLDLSLCASTRVLECKANRIGTKGAILLSQVLEKNTTLVRVNVIGNGITFEGIEALLGIYEKREALRLDLRRNRHTSSQSQRYKELSRRPHPPSLEMFRSIRSVYRTATPGPGSVPGYEPPLQDSEVNQGAQQTKTKKRKSKKKFDKSATQNSDNNKKQKKTSKRRKWKRMTPSDKSPMDDDSFDVDVSFVDDGYFCIPQEYCSADTDKAIEPPPGHKTNALVIELMSECDVLVVPAAQSHTEVDIWANGIIVKLSDDEIWVYVASTSRNGGGKTHIINRHSELHKISGLETRALQTNQLLCGSS